MAASPGALQTQNDDRKASEMSFFGRVSVRSAAIRILSMAAISAGTIPAAMPGHAAELLVGPGLYPGPYPGAYLGGNPGPYPGFAAPPYAFPPAREAAPGTARALDGVRNGTTREERDRHGGPEIDLTGRPLLTGRYREFQF